MLTKYACSLLNSLPSSGLRSSKTFIHVFRRLFVASSITFVLLTSFGCQKPKNIAFVHQGLLVGRVIDAVARSPVAGAILSDTPIHTSVSDPQGAFTLALPEGSGILLISAPGYRPMRIPFTVQAGKSSFPTPEGYITLTPLSP